LIQHFDIHHFLDEKFVLYNRHEFVKNDPISIPHLFSRKEDIEISAFLTASITWGRRQQSIKNARKWMSIMEDSPYEYVLHASNKEKRKLNDFVHRTFNGTDCRFFIESLKNIYLNEGGLEQAFLSNHKNLSIKKVIIDFRSLFLNTEHQLRSEKHIANPQTGSAAKRINMFLRWMVRNDNRGVDFGIWPNLKPNQLMIPLDVHTASIARKLGLLNRKQNDWQAVEELTAVLRAFDPNDPVKYDFALFGLGIFEKF